LESEVFRNFDSNGFFMDKNVIAFQEYLLREKNYSELTVNAYLKDVNDFRSFLKLDLNEQAIERVHYGQIRNWIVFLSDNKVSNRSINRKISSLKAFYKFLLKIKEIEVNPLSEHRSLRMPKKIQIPFSEKELQDVLKLEFQDDFEGIRNRLIIELLYATGMRRAELINLKLSSIDLSSGTIKVVGKRNKERILPLLQSILGSIQRYLIVRSSLEQIKDSDYFFVTKNGVKLYQTLVYRIINSYFSNVSEKVKRSPHVLRHSFATHLLDNGADLNSVKELLGHSSLASTQIYVNSSLSELKKVYANAHPRNKK